MELSLGWLFVSMWRSPADSKVSLVLLMSDKCQQFDIFVSQGFILVITDQKTVLEMIHKI